MGILRRFFIPQAGPDNGSRNRRALACLLELGFPPDRTRKALLDLNGIRIRDVLKDAGTPSSSIYRQIQRPTNRAAARVFAEKLGLKEEELFPELQ